MEGKGSKDDPMAVLLWHFRFVRCWNDGRSLVSLMPDPECRSYTMMFLRCGQRSTMRFARVKLVVGLTVL